MNAPPPGLDEKDLLPHLTDAWGLRAPALTYAQLGFGAYHWIATEPGGDRYFITVHDLDAEPWLGDDRDAAFDGLGRAFVTALTLHREGCLEFVAAPMPDHQGAAVRRVDDRYSLAVHPFLEGSTGDFGAPVAAEDLGSVVGLLARLHDATALVEPVALHRSFEVPDRAEIEEALAALGSPWAGGPFAERARGWLEANAGGLMRLLATYDRLRERIESRARPVITHGEPHQGNLLWSDGRLLLIDWDTVSLAPPERDLWLVNGGSAEVREMYSRISGREVDEAAIDFYAIGWQLTDAACFLQQFRNHHEADADAEFSWRVMSGWEL
ncbi:MAG TPA: phosphotransferase [Candidatus Dormibacteraeota bacterium]|jgi:spectinomycin phosphotransferase|nr:phosphotransferase [Candidatus Dormibacteraeota bacterium]